MSTSDSSTEADGVGSDDFPPFTEDDLKTLKANATSPSHPLMKLMGKLTLHKLSPFKVSPAQALSCADFSANPWPKKGEAVETTYGDVLHDFELTVSGISWSSSTAIATAEGLMVVIGTCYAAVSYKVSEYSKLNTDGFQDLCPVSDTATDQPLHEDTLKEALNKNTSEWIVSVINWCRGANPKSVLGMPTSDHAPKSWDVTEFHSTYRRAADIGYYRLENASNQTKDVENSKESVKSKSTRESWLGSIIPSWATENRKPSRASVDSRAQSGAFGANMETAVGAFSTTSLTASGDLALQSEMLAMTAKVAQEMAKMNERSSLDSTAAGGNSDKGKGRADP